MATPSELFNESRCYLCLGMSVAQALKLAFLRRWLLALDPAADTSPSALTAQACLICASGGSIAEMLEIALLSLISERSEIDAIVDDFASRAGISDQTQLDALTDLVASARANGWWDLCDIIYPFVGGTAAAHAENLKSSSFTITWSGTVTHDANGVTGNGTDGYGATGYDPSINGVLYQLNSAHLSAYRRNFGNGNGRYAGCNGGGVVYFRHSSGGNILSGCNDGVATGLITASLGLVMVTRTAAAAKALYSSGASATAVNASTTLAMPGVSILAATNADTTVGSFSTVNLAFLTIGSGITSAMYQTMQSDIQTFQTALGRQV